MIYLIFRDVNKLIKFLIFYFQDQVESAMDETPNDRANILSNISQGMFDLLDAEIRRGNQLFLRQKRNVNP